MPFWIVYQPSTGLGIHVFRPDDVEFLRDAFAYRLKFGIVGAKEER